LVYYRKIRIFLVIDQEKRRLFAVFTKKMLFFIVIPQKITIFAQNAILYESRTRRYQPVESCARRAKEDQQVAGRATWQGPSNSE
jgi:hypothetical protein